MRRQIEVTWAAEEVCVIVLTQTALRLRQMALRFGQYSTYDESYSVLAKQVLEKFKRIEREKSVVMDDDAINETCADIIEQEEQDD